MRQLNRQRGVQVTLTALRYLRAQLPHLRTRMAQMERARREAGSKKTLKRGVSGKYEQAQLTQKNQTPTAAEIRVQKIEAEVQNEITAFKSALSVYESAQIEHLAIRADILRWKNALYHRIMQFYRDRKAHAPEELPRFFTGDPDHFRLPGAYGKLMLQAHAFLQRLTQNEVAVAKSVEEALHYLKHALMEREAARQKEDSYKAMREQAMDRAQLFYNSLYKRLLAIYPGMADYVEICFYDLPKLERSVKKSDPQMTLPDREQRYAEALRVAEALKTLDCEVDNMEGSLSDVSLEAFLSNEILPENNSQPPQAELTDSLDATLDTVFSEEDSPEDTIESSNPMEIGTITIPPRQPSESGSR